METKKNNIEFIPKFEKSFFTAALLGRLAGGSLPSPVLR